MAYQEVLGTDTPNEGRTKLNANATELYARDATFTVVSEAAMIALSAKKGDIAIRTDLTPDGAYRLTTNDPTLAANWAQISGFGGDSSGIASIDGVSNAGGNVDLVAGSGMTITPDDTANTITFVSSGGGSLIAPITVLYWTAESNHLIYSNMPSSVIEWYQGNATLRPKADLTNATQARIYVRVGTAGAVGSQMRAQYSTDGTTWNYLDGASGPAAALQPAGYKESAWVSITAGAKADVYLRVITIDGDGVTDPAIGLIAVQVR